jgi:putative ABC transport system permease protein
MLTTLKILWNSFMMALQELRVNKLRTFLSLLGIMIGIFCIIAVLTITGSLESNVRDEVQSLGTNVVYIQKWPWGGGGEYPWWKYLNRPEPNYQEFKDLQQRVTDASAFCYSYDIGNREVDYGEDYMTAVTMLAITQDFDKIQDLEINDGRYFSPTETNGNGAVIILGANIWKGLFGTANKAIGKEVSLGGKQLRVVGTLNVYGSGIINAYDFDNSVLVPYLTAREIVSDKSGDVDPQIIVQARSDVSVPELKDQLRPAMRAIRRLTPTAEDNFSLNELSMISGNLDKLFGSITAGGWIIGIFALIVGGFGIANIMFVSVKERTNIIGIKKAIGAKRSTILLEFLLESILLCLIGGLMGILLVYIGTKLASGAFSYTIYLSVQNFTTGIVVSVVTGVVAGFVPAYFASKLDPVVAIRS